MTQCNNFNFNCFKACVNRRLHDEAVQEWNSHVFESSKCLNYSILKNKFVFETYLNNLPNKFKKSLTKFRCRNNLLPIEIGSYYNIPRNERTCTLCINDNLGDEYHYLLVCPFFKTHRESYLDLYFCSGPSTLKLNNVFNSTGK